MERPIISEADVAAAEARLAERIGNLSMPWSDAEFIHVNGHPLAYAFEGGKYRIRFAEGVTMTKAQLVAAGHTVALPERPRKSDSAAYADKGLAEPV
jgi:hypothetical protein